MLILDVQIKSSLFMFNVDTFIKHTSKTSFQDICSKVVDRFRILKYNNMFAKDYFRDRAEGVLVVKEVKDIVLRTYVVEDLTGSILKGTFCEQEL